MIFTIFPCWPWYYTVPYSSQNSENHGISDRFFELSHSVFRVKPSYLVFRELSEYVFRKIKRFCEKNIFSRRGVDFRSKIQSFATVGPRGPVPFSPNLSEVSDKIDLARRVFGVGRASACSEPRKGNRNQLPWSFERTTRFLDSPKRWFPFFPLNETRGTIYTVTWWNPLFY